MRGRSFTYTIALFSRMGDDDTRGPPDMPSLAVDPAEHAPRPPVNRPAHDTSGPQYMALLPTARPSYNAESRRPRKRAVDARNPSSAGESAMKRMMLVAVMAAMMSPVLSAQTDQEMIDRSVLAAPANARAAAAVVKWNADGTRVEIRPGTTAWCAGI